MSKRDIEITGLSARLYDTLVLFGTLGHYQRILEDAICSMNIKPRDRILDLGAGTGKNEILMRSFLGDEGRITALEIGVEMRAQFARKCGSYPNIRLENRRIEEPLPYRDEFDKVFVSFVVHGFSQEERESIVENAYLALKSGGRLFIFDWNEMDLEKEGVLFRLFMRYVECDLARDFIQRDIKASLVKQRFHSIVQKLYYKGRIRLQMAQK